MALALLGPNEKVSRDSSIGASAKTNTRASPAPCSPFFRSLLSCSLGPTFAWSLHFSPAGDRTQNQQRLISRCHRVGQRFVRRFQRPVFFAGKEAQKRAPLARRVIANGSAQHGVTRFERVQNRTNGDRRGNFKQHIAFDVRQVAQMIRQPDTHSCCARLRRRGRLCCFGQGADSLIAGLLFSCSLISCSLLADFLISDLCSPISDLSLADFLISDL